ncbi:MAG TPA: DUF305 domain-containing protein [Aldersonia sp.]
MTDTAVGDHPPAKRSQRTALAVLGIIAAIAVGFALGFFARLPLDDGGTETPGADSVDVGFAQDMSVHHSQAAEMASIALTQSQDQAVRNLAYDILTTQQNQIGQMQGWLSLWGQPSLPSGEYMTWMSSDDGQSHDHSTAGGSAQMPGMASSAEMSALRQATGTALDVQFLQLMLRHHQGGLPMMEYAAEYAQTSTVRQLAQTMVNTQTSESTLMTQMLSERGATPLPMN